MVEPILSSTLLLIWVISLDTEVRNYIKDYINSYKVMKNTIFQAQTSFHHEKQHGFVRFVGKCYTYQ